MSQQYLKFLGLTTDTEIYKFIENIKEIVEDKELLEKIYKKKNIKENIEEIKKEICIVLEIENKNKKMIEFLYKKKKNIIELTNIISLFKNIIMSDYINRHIMYFLLTDMDVLLNKIIIKIGYSYNLQTRINSLENEHNCNFLILDVKEINAEQEEQYFHSFLQKNHKNLCYIQSNLLKENFFRSL